MRIRTVGFALAVLLVVAFSLAPALWQVSTALMPDRDITSSPAVYWPNPPTLDHVRSLFSRKPFGSYLVTSAIVSASSTLLSVFLASLAAATLARFPESRRRPILSLLLLVALFPPILLLFPIYEAARSLALLNHPLALAIPYAAFGLPFAVFVLTAGFRAIPDALEEAALLDGLSPLGRLFRVHLPLAAPSVATAAILVFIASWNEFLFALTFLTRDEAKTVTAGIASVSGSSLFEVPWGPLAAGVVVATLPLVLLVALFQRRITSGLTRGAVKG